jgi:hypothetical protein
MYNRLYLAAKWICSTCWSICGFYFAQRPCRAVRDCISAVVIEVATRSWYIMMLVKVVGGQRSEEDKMKGADDVARTGAFPLQRCRRVATSGAAKDRWDKMRFKASIQNIHTFTSKRMPICFATSTDHV